ncbi:MAG: HlyD family efflux transporter periplasmic adaptor subunit [Clostridia bacterium]|nr:HlyD family efflux transporter periplasmic adaptor subunit [Clostridia bacterium]
MKNQRNYLSVIFLLLGVFILAGCSLNTVSAETATGEIIVEGTVEAKEITVASKVPGRIAEVLVEEGMKIKNEQTLLQLETKEMEAKKKQAEGALMGAQAIHQKAKNGARPQEIELARANVIMAEAKAKLLEDTYKRLKNLHEAGAYTTQELQKTETEFIAAKAQAKQANEQLGMALEGARQEDIMAAQANVLRAEGAFDEINTALDEATIKTPLKGTVDSVMHYKGELIGTGTPLFTITDYSDVWAEVNLKDSEVNKIKIGDEVNVEFEDTKSLGKVLSINRNPDFAIIKSTNDMTDRDIITYLVKVKILEPQNFFPGMRVKVAF